MELATHLQTQCPFFLHRDSMVMTILPTPPLPSAGVDPRTYPRAAPQPQSTPFVEGEGVMT